VYAEQEYLVSTVSGIDALADVVCAYFAFDLVYPKNIYHISLINTPAGVLFIIYTPEIKDFVSK